MATISRLMSPIILTAVTAVVANQVSCVRNDGSGTSYDYLYVQFGPTPAVAGNITIGFMGSLNNYAPYSYTTSAASYVPVTGWAADDAARALVTGFALVGTPAAQKMYVIPVLFNWFSLVCTLQTGSQAIYAEIFAS